MQVSLIERVTAELDKAEITRDQARAELRTIDLDDAERIAQITQKRADAAALVDHLTIVLREHERAVLRPSLHRTEALKDVDLALVAIEDIPFERRFQAEIMDLQSEHRRMGTSWPDNAGDEEQQRGNALGAIGQRINARALCHCAQALEGLWNAHANDAPIEFLLTSPVMPSETDEKVLAHTQAAINAATRRDAAGATALLVTTTPFPWT